MARQLGTVAPVKCKGMMRQMDAFFPGKKEYRQSSAPFYEQGEDKFKLFPTKENE